MTHPQVFPIAGMTCGGCAAKVSARLLEHPDIATASVGIDPPEAMLSTTQPLSEAAVNEWLHPLGKYRVDSDLAPPTEAAVPKETAPPKNATTYRPLLVLLGYLLVVTLSVSPGDLMNFMHLFMGGFFIAFSFFKMLDLRGFADAYRGYDIVAKAVPGYGLVYPFIELSLGLAYIGFWQPRITYWATVIVMGLSLIGVLRAVLSKQTIRCACLGTVFNLPMSTVTIVEDGLMIAMAALMLVM